MADNTSLDPDAARSENSKLRDNGYRFGDSTTRMTDAAKTYDGCWGGDEFGEAFAKGYVPNAQKFLEYINVFSQNIKKTVDQVDKAILSLEDTDNNNAKNMG